jgi:hypothetical protein
MNTYATVLPYVEYRLCSCNKSILVKEIYLYSTISCNCQLMQMESERHQCQLTTAYCITEVVLWLTNSCLPAP